MLYLLW